MHTRVRGVRAVAATLLAVVALATAAVAPAAAITDGTLDGSGHPYVGLMVALGSDGNPLWRCSGTLLSNRVYITAGHCVSSPASHIEIFFASGPIPLAAGYPAAGARYVAYPYLVQINTNFVGDFALLLSDNAHSGGACFGDSGGPNFLGSSTTIAAVTDFVLNTNCAGVGGVYRLDREVDRDWIEGFP